jgi:hypothetical protein
MLTQSIHCAMGCFATSTAFAPIGPLANIDWIGMTLWAVASLVAVSLLAVAMNRRRTTLTDALKKHVVDTIGPVGGEEEENGEKRD